jgi:uroporphyrinogen-III synthase
MTPTLIVTRPKAQSESFAAAMKVAWSKPLTVIQSPLINIKMLGVSVGDADEVIFTSVNGVAASAGMETHRGMRAWCVGDRTAKAAQDAGFVPTVGPGDAAGLVAVLIAARPTGRLVHIRGRHSRGDVAARLKAAGLHCRDVIGYDQQALRLSDAAQAAVDGDTSVIFPLFSPRTSTILSEHGPFKAPVHVVALSDAVADAVDPALELDCHVARSTNSAAMQTAVLSVLESLSVHR